MTVTINFINRKPAKTIIWKTLNILVGVTTILNVSLVGTLVSPQIASAQEDPASSVAPTSVSPDSVTTGAVCPPGNVKYEVSSGYEYTDNTGTVSVVPAGNKNKTTWLPASGSLITAICVKIGGSDGGSLIYPNPSLGTAGPFNYDISHVVLYTRPVSNQCTLYGIQDQNTVDSLFYQINLQNGSISQIGTVANGYDIEAMDAHPDTGVIYGMSGDQNDSASKKKLLVLDPTTGIPNYSTGVQLDLGAEQEIQGASFNPVTKELWVGGDGDFDLRTLNTTTGVSTLKKSVSGSPEALAWKPDGSVLYYSIEDDLKTYNPSTNNTGSACSNVGGEIESLEYDDVGNLIMATHGNSTLYRINPQTCAKVPLYTTTHNDTETMTFDCAAPPEPTRLTVIKHFDDDGDGDTDRTNPQGWTWDIVDGSQNNPGGIPVGVAAGDYTVTEDPIDDYASRWECSDQTSGTGTSLNASVDVAQNLICTFTNVVTPVCNLEITKAILVNQQPVTQSTADPGDEVTYRLNFQNTGAATCTGGGVKVQDVLNSNLAYVSSSELHSSNVNFGYSSTPGHSNGTLTWNANNLTPGESGWVEWRAQVNAQPVCTNLTIPNYGRITSAEYPGWPSNPTWVNSNTVETSVSTSCQGKLTVTKIVVNDNGGTKVVSNFPLFVDATPVTSGVQNDFNAGQYTVSETNQAGYTATIGGDCASNGSITLNPGDVKSCTITNNDIQPKLTVTKVVINDNGGTKVVSDFPLFVNASPVTSGIQNGFNAGQYVVSETTDPDYTSSISGDCAANGSITLNPGDVKSCTITNDDIAPTITLIKNVINNNGGNAGANDFGLTIGGTGVNSGQTLPVNANTPVAINEAGLTGYEFVSITGDEGCPETLGGTVTLNESDNLTCTITNDDIAPTITLIKNVINNNDGNAGPNDFGLEIDGQTVNSGDPTTVDANTDIEINEAGLAGYEFVSISGDEGCPEELEDTVTLNEGENLTCTITNDDVQPRLVVTKIVINSNGSNAVPSDFTMHVSGANASPASFPGSNSGTLVTLDQGAYSVTEDSLDGFDPVFSSDCTGSIDVGETKYCTVTNTALAPHLLVIKTIVNDNGGNNVESNFTMNVTAGDPSPASFPGNPVGTLVELDLGPYSVDETGPAGYAKTLSPDCAGTIVLGQTKICEITNNDIAPTITLIKNVINNNGGNADPNDFGLTIGGTDVYSGQPLPVNANTPISLNEAGLTGYAFVSITGDEGCPETLGGTVTLNEVENLTCTITNDDIQPKLTVTKIVVNDNGGTKVVADFPLFVNFTPVTSGVQNGFTAGSYTVNEVGDAGYAASITGDCTADGSITLNPGDVKSCTITNNDVLPTITLDKQGQATVIAGDNITYTLAWAVGAAPVTNAVINDTVPTNTSFVSAGCGTTTGTCIVNSATSTITWGLGSRNPGESGTVTLTVKSNSPLTNGTVITNIGIFDTDQTEQVSDTVTTTVSSLPTLGLQKSAAPTTVPAGQNVTWTVNWSVAGNSVATNVVIVDPIPTNSTFVSVADAGVYDAVTNKITWSLGTKSPGASGEVHYVIKTASPIANGTVITNTATIDSAETDPPFSASASVAVTSAPDLTIAKTSSVTTFTNPGQPVTYTVTVTNKATATDTAKNVVLTDTLPSGFTFAVDGSTTKSFTIGNLAPGQSATVTYLVNISGSQTAGTYNNSAKAKGDNTSEVTATAPVEVRVPQVLGVTTPDLTIGKIVNKSTAKPGDVVTYTITVKNIGDADATNVVITDTLPKNLSFVHGTGRTMTWEIGTLEAGRSRVINLDVRVESDAKSGDYQNVAVVSADDVPPQQAAAKLTVKTPKVLGLAATGAGPLDYFIGLLGAALIWAGMFGLKRRQPELAQ